MHNEENVAPLPVPVLCCRSDSFYFTSPHGPSQVWACSPWPPLRRGSPAGIDQGVLSRQTAALPLPLCQVCQQLCFRPQVEVNVCTHSAQIPQQIKTLLYQTTAGKDGEQRFPTNRLKCSHFFQRKRKLNVWKITVSYSDFISIPWRNVTLIIFQAH